MTVTLAPGTAADIERVLLVDDRPLMQAGLSAMLAGASSVTHADSVDDAVDILRHHDIRVVLVATHLAGADAWRALADAAPGSQLIALGPCSDARPPAGFVELAETAAAAEICAVVAAADHRHPRRDPKPPPAGPPDLTPQEARILGLIGDGLSNREIAGRLGIAEKTVKNYITGLFAKIQVTRRTHAAAVAWRLAG